LHFSAGRALWARQETARPPAAWPQHRFLTTRKIVGMINGHVCIVVGAAFHQAELIYVWTQATLIAKAIIVCLIFFSIVVWSTMVSKAVQMRRARKLNHYFNEEFRAQKSVLDIFDRKLQVEGCPLYSVYQTGCVQLDARLHGPGGERRKQSVTLKNMEHVKRAVENVVAQESLKLESGLIWLARRSSACSARFGGS
jgi:hypothetical protein